MLKILLGIIIVGLTTIVGKKATKRHILRTNFFSSLSEFNSALLRDLAYKKDGVVSVLKKKYQDEEFNEYVRKVSFAYINNEQTPFPPEFLSETDKKTVTEYFYEIGRYGERAQKDYLKVKREEFAEKVTELKKISDKFSTLGSKLGFALGAVLFILIV